MLEDSVSDHLERALFSWPERVFDVDGQGTLSRQDTGLERTRVAAMFTNTTDKSLYQYGKRNKDGENIVVPVPAIVSEQLWDAAQEALGRSRIRPRHAKNIYPLRSLM